MWGAMSSHGETVGDALGAGHEVGAHAEVLVGKEAARASVAALDFVADEERAVGVAGASQPLQELGRGHADAAHALDALHDDGRHVALGQFGLEGGEVIEGQEGHVARVVDGSHDARVVGGLDGERGAAVESLLGGQHAAAARDERGQLQRVLVGLRAGVDEEELVVGIAREAAETFGELLLEAVDDGVGVEA